MDVKTQLDKFGKKTMEHLNQIKILGLHLAKIQTCIPL